MQAPPFTAQNPTARTSTAEKYVPHSQRGAGNAVQSSGASQAEASGPGAAVASGGIALPDRLPMSAPLPIPGLLPAALRPASERPRTPAGPSPVHTNGAVRPKPPPLPKKARTHSASLPRAPRSVASTFASQDSQRSRRDVKAPHRFNGITQLGYDMMELEEYTHAAGEGSSDAQPFAIIVHPRALVAADIHAHLCMNEVIGVFGGSFDAAARRLHIVNSLAVQEGLLAAGKTDVEMDPADQSRAIEELRRDGLQCVGWYHSHPTFAVLPSTIDVYNQHAQQVGHAHNAGDVNATPYVAAIVGPYAPHAGGAQSQMSWFYVENRRPEQFSLGQAPEACLQHMVPKTLAVTLQEEAAVAVEEVLADAEPLLQRYCVHEHRTDFSEEWQPGMTKLQKMVSSVQYDLRCYLDSDQLRSLGVQLLQNGWQRFCAHLGDAKS